MNSQQNTEIVQKIPISRWHARTSTHTYNEAHARCTYTGRDTHAQHTHTLVDSAIQMNQCCDSVLLFLFFHIFDGINTPFIF